MERPKVIFFDAVGTLFGIRGSVGSIYSEVAQHFGVKTSAQNLNEAFIQTFKAAEPLAFPEATPAEIPELEFQWWEAITRTSFEKVGVVNHFSDFSAFFTQLYQHFATAEPWYIYPDVFPRLKRWRDKGMELGIVSNFDSRLYAVLQTLELKDFFSSITISSAVGAAKPDAKIFAAALEKHHIFAHQGWHVGDSFKEDYQGATAAGVRAFLLKR